MKNVSWFDAPDDMSSATTCQTVCSNLSPRMRMILSKTVWVISTARNAVIVVICALMAYGFDPVLPDPDQKESHALDLHSDNHTLESDVHHSYGPNTTFILTGNINGGLPAFQSPPFSIGNYSDPKGDPHYTPFSGMLSNLGSAIIILPLLVILENVAIAKAFGKYRAK